MNLDHQNFGFLRAIDEATRAVSSWPEWMRRATRRVPISAPGVNSTVYVIDGLIYRHPPHWYREEQEQADS